MGFCFYPKHEHRCPHVNHCPHLGGAALGSVVHLANQKYDQHVGVWRRVEDQEKLIQTLRARVAELTDQLEQTRQELRETHRRQFRRSADQAMKQEAASSPTQKPSGKKRGAPVGHQGASRTRREPDHTVLVEAPAYCPHCESRVKVYDDRPPREHSQDDVIDGRMQTILFLHPWARCVNSACRRWVQMPGPDELLGARIGPHARSRFLFLRLNVGMSLSNARMVLLEFTGLKATPAAVIGFELDAAEKASPLADDVAKKLSSCSVNHADETHWPVNGKPWYGWFHGNVDLAHFALCPTRAGVISRVILGSFGGTLVTDCYSGYRRHQVARFQKCLAHVRRTALQWQLKTTGNAQAQAYFEQVVHWTERCMDFDAGRGDRDPQREIPWLNEELVRLEECPTTHELTRRLQKRLIRHHGEWLTFVKYPEVPATNNLAERALRPLVLIRKITFGHRSERMARGLGVLMTVVVTAKRQGRAVLEFLKALLCLPTAQALRAMYAARSARGP